jgi:hypothetical protein
LLQAEATEPKQSIEQFQDPAHVLAHEVRLEKRDSPERMAAMLQLGNLEAGKTYEIELQVHNPTSRDLPFTGVSSTCGCVKFEADREAVPANGSVKLVFQLRTPPRSGTLLMTNSVRFVDGTTKLEAFGLGVRYQLYNMFKIVGNQWTIEVPDSAEQESLTSRMPILIAAPMTHEDLEIVLSETLRDLTTRFVHADGQHFIEVTTHKKNITGSSISGDLFVRRKGSEDFDVVNLVVKLQPTISLNPVSVRLVKSSTGEYFHAKAILRIRRPPSEANDANNENQQAFVDPQPVIELLIGSEPAKVTYKKLGDSGIYAVTIRYDGPAPENPGSVITAKWAVRACGKEVGMEAAVYFPE